MASFINQNKNADGIHPQSDLTVFIISASLCTTGVHRRNYHNFLSNTIAGWHANSIFSHLKRCKKN